MKKFIKEYLKFKEKLNDAAFNIGIVLGVTNKECLELFKIYKGQK